jgi:RsbT co-antagonist protein rsbRD N-terminal domain
LHQKSAEIDFSNLRSAGLSAAFAWSNARCASRHSRRAALGGERRMRLSEFIRANIDQIVQEWEEFAKTLSAGTALPRWILRDHAPAILKRIADDMEVPQSPVEEEAKSKGERPSGPIERSTAAIHVSVRIESGFDLVQIMAEYRALRSCVLRMWRQSHPDSFARGAEEITRFAEAIDQNVAEVVPYYQERENQYRDRFLGILGHDLRNPSMPSRSECPCSLRTD